MSPFRAAGSFETDMSRVDAVAARPQPGGHASSASTCAITSSYRNGGVRNTSAPSANPHRAAWSSFCESNRSGARDFRFLRAYSASYQ
jgi:hypothetical protein